MDRYRVEGISVHAVIGVNEWERATTQRLVIDVDYWADAGAAAASDRLDGTVDYREICGLVCERVGSSRFHLIEAVAEDVAMVILSRPGIQRVRVAVHKPSALRAAGDVCVTFVRRMATPSREVYVGVISNTASEGDLRWTVARLHEEHGALRVSEVFRAQAGDGTGPDRLAIAVGFRSGRPPVAIGASLRAIEDSLGRSRAPVGQPSIEVCLLLCGDVILDDGGLTLPHPNLTSQTVLLAPLAEIARSVLHPALGVTIGGLHSRLAGELAGMEAVRGLTVY